MVETYVVDARRAHQEAARLLARRDFQAAEQVCRDTLKEHPRDGRAWFLLGNVLAEAGRLRDALDPLSRAVAADREQPEYFALLARCLVQLNAPKAARDAAARAAQLEPDDALVNDTLGWVYARLGDHEQAVRHFRLAVSRAPDNAQFQFNLAAARKFTGDFDAAESAYERAIAVRPDFYQAHWALANLRRQSDERNHVARLEQLLADAPPTADDELYLRHALAKELEDLGDTAGAFANWKAGNARKKAELGYSLNADEALFETLIDSFTANTCANPPPGEASAEPIFVVGMPRTGTTLVERIIASHSVVYGAGELQNFGLVLKRASGSQSPRVLDPEVVRSGLDADPEALGRAYIDSTRPRTGHTAFFTDKTPLNFLLVGFIHRALPNAKIVCLRRDPLDTCLSNFRQLFATGFSYYNYAYDIEDTARYYLLFDRLMAHWDAVLPGRVLRLDYDALVADQEEQTRRLLGHLGLTWDPACLEFQRHAAPVATASAVQVREPIYRSAAGRWRRYAKQLEPARRILEAAGIRVA
ncbi:MAG: sulfotransferase [Chromatiales bacterium]|nr:MAG: sulfotransferase [Chromatiales bacterium]